jgi:hypothetical protein
MVWIAAAIGVGGALLGSSSNRKAAKKAGQATEQGIQRVEQNTGLRSTYSPGGQRAFSQAQNLLGVGGGTPETMAASQGGFQNYLDSAGYRTQMKGGIDALNSNAAARGMLKSGATLKATQRFGSGLGQQYFNNYIGQLMGQAQMGQSADTTMANVYTGGAAAQANAQMAAGKASADGFAGAATNIAGAIGDKRGAPATTPGAAAPSNGAVATGATGAYTGPRG